MSVRKRGRHYEVRWSEGGQKPSRTFLRKEDATAFDIDVKRRKQLGALAPGVIQSRQTLAEFMEEEWWPRYAIPNLADDTRRRYLEVWGTHLLPRVGDYELRAITSLLVEDLRDQLTLAKVPAPTQRKALMLLQGILRRAVVRGLIPANPVQLVAKPKQAPTIIPQPLAPLTVERIRAQLRPRDAMIVSLLAYAGLRPSEDRAGRWADVHGRALHVTATKTGRGRDVDLLTPLAQDLAEWRLASGRPAGKELIVPRPTGGEWTRADWANWRRRIWRPAAIGAGVTGDLRPYRLRGSFVSLLLWEGRSLAYVAEQAGHSIATLAKHYSGVIRELEDKPRMPAAEAIREAREQITDRRRRTG
ncbi:MAG: site-specific integrase [Solirubrobacteraceae bacterium]